MRTFLQSLKISALVMIVMTLLLGIVYPMFMYGIGHFFFHHKAHGSIIYDQHKNPLGSSLIGQNFSNPRYFHPRPSFAGSLGYDGTDSLASNLGPTSKKLYSNLKSQVDKIRKTNSLAAKNPIPVDAVCASGSGLDPHISLENAYLQSVRVSSKRKIPVKAVQDLIEKHAESRFLGVFGDRRVNVLKLNLALDALDG